VRPIVVEDNVFIGARAIVLPGVVIGSNSVVAAGSVVTKHVPQGVVVAGVPAQVISTTKEYARKLDSCVQTKGLSAREKKRKLLEIWGWMPNQRKERLLAVGACETTEQPL
jgi:serine acetyltransferase